MWILRRRQLGRISFILLGCLFIGAAPSVSLSTATSSLSKNAGSGIGFVGTAKNGRRPSFLHARNSIDDTESTKSKKPTTAVIVGGGPGGLASALVLSTVQAPRGSGKGPHNPHSSSSNNNNHKDSSSQFLFDRIIVVDRLPKEKACDPNRVYFFNLNQRGQTFTDAFGIDLSVKGSPAAQGFAKHSVPANPNVIFDEHTKPFSPTPTTGEINYWIPRHELVELIMDKIRGTQEVSSAGTTHRAGIIEFRHDAACEYIEPTGNGMVKVALKEGRDKTEHNFILADFCVGADGISSNVRRSLENGRFHPSAWLNANSKGFRLKKYTSPATGLRFKGLRVNGRFAIPRGGKKGERTRTIPLSTKHTYTLRSATKGLTDRFPLTNFPQKNVSFGRFLNICTEPNHDIWNPSVVRTDDGGRSAKAFFQKAHPRYDWDAIVTDDEWKHFAASKGSRFPQCQYSPAMYVASTESPSDSIEPQQNVSSLGTGVVLVGDALHAFPPDLGQGVNVALRDAMVLGESFKEAAKESVFKTSNRSFMADALKRYQATNGPEIRALVHLARIGAPFQYNQSSLVNRFKKVLWFANIALRFVLNKATLGLSPQPAILMSINPTMSFRQIMRKANTLTAVLWTSALLVVASLFRTRMPLCSIGFRYLWNEYKKYQVSWALVPLAIFLLKQINITHIPSVRFLTPDQSSPNGYKSLHGIRNSIIGQNITTAF